MSDRSEWETPDEFFSVISYLFLPTVDACATARNSKCARYVAPPWHEGETREHEQHTEPRSFNGGEPQRPRAIGCDLLTLDDRDSYRMGQGPIWCNPPYGRVQPWLAKAVTHFRQYRSTWLVLTHAGIGSDWFHAMLGHCAAVWILKPRINFVPPPGLKGQSNPRDSILWIFRPRPELPPGLGGYPAPMYPFDWKSYQKAE